MEIINIIIRIISDTILWMGYPGIFILMFLESSLFPFPSEIVLIPAGYHAYNGEMNIFLVIFTGTLGSLCGALFNYYIARTFGIRMLAKYGKYIFISDKSLERIEKFFYDHGHISTFTGRLIPVIRQYISLPAGIGKMNIFEFIFYTTIGSLIWVIILALFGYFIGGNKELVDLYMSDLTLYTIIFITLLIAVYYLLFVKKPFKKNK